MTVDAAERSRRSCLKAAASTFSERQSMSYQKWNEDWTLILQLQQRVLEQFKRPASICLFTGNPTSCKAFNETKISKTRHHTQRPLSDKATSPNTFRKTRCTQNHKNQPPANHQPTTSQPPANHQPTTSQPPAPQPPQKPVWALERRAQSIR